MAYEYERDEWRSAVQSMSQLDRDLTRDAIRRSLGIAGDPSDAIADCSLGGDMDGDED